MFDVTLFILYTMSKFGFKKTAVRIAQSIEDRLLPDPFFAAAVEFLSMGEHGFATCADCIRPVMSGNEYRHNGCSPAKAEQVYSSLVPLIQQTSQSVMDKKTNAFLIDRLFGEIVANWDEEDPDLDDIQSCLLCGEFEGHCDCIPERQCQNCGQACPPGECREDRVNRDHPHLPEITNGQ